MSPSNNCLIQNNYKLEKNNQKWAVLSSKQTGPKLPDTKAAICSLLCNLFECHFKVGAVSKIVPTKSGQNHARLFDNWFTAAATAEDFFQGETTHKPSTPYKDFEFREGSEWRLLGSTM